MLRRGSFVHETFITSNGLSTCYNWLVEMPDGTYPNQKIVYKILEQIDRIEIEKDTLLEKDSQDIENALQMYSSGVPGTGYHECASLAKQIINKWNRIKFDIKTHYDDCGEYDDGYRTFKRKLDKERIVKQTTITARKRQRIDEDEVH